MRYFSMFTGIGGFELGIQRAFSIRNGATADPNSEALEQGVEPTAASVQPDGDKLYAQFRGDSRPLSCIGYSEIDKHAIKTYEEHYAHENYGDATAIDPAALPAFDLLVGGFPCQAFSVAGKRRGFEDTRGTLFFDVARILAEKRSRHLVLENVKGLLNHNGGETVQKIFGVLSDLGYRVEWQVLNSKHFGVPQNRERIYIVGHLRAGCTGKIFPITRDNRQPTYPSQDASHGQRPVVKRVGQVWGGQSGRVYDDRGLSPTLSTMTGGGLKQPKIVQRARGKNPGGSHDVAPTVSAHSYQDNNHVVWGEPVPDPDTGEINPNSQIRRLTPVECERLQSFPDGWTIGSDSQRYKQCGNAVTVNVVAAVVGKLLEVGCLNNR